MSTSKTELEELINKVNRGEAFDDITNTVNQLFEIIDKASTLRSDELEIDMIDSLIEALIALHVSYMGRKNHADVHLFVWRRYLTLLKPHHRSISCHSILKITQLLIEYIDEGIKALTDTNEGIQLINAIKIIYFFCQRLSATIAYMLPKLTLSIITSSYITLSKFCGILNSSLIAKVEVVSSEILRVQELTKELFIKSFTKPEVNPTINQYSEMNLSYRRLRYHDTVMTFMTSEYAVSVSSNNSINHADGCWIISGFISFSLTDLSNLLQKLKSNVPLRDSVQLNSIISPASIIKFGIDELLFCFDIMTTLFCGFLEDQKLLLYLDTLVVVIVELLEQLNSEMNCIVIALLIKLCLCPGSDVRGVWGRFLLSGISVACHQHNQSIIVTTMTQYLLNEINISYLTSPIRLASFPVADYANTLRSILLVCDDSNAIFIINQFIVLVNDLSSHNHRPSAAFTNGSCSGERGIHRRGLAGTTATSTTTVSQYKEEIMRNLNMIIEGVLKELPLQQLLLRGNRELAVLCRELVVIGVKGIIRYSQNSSESTSTSTTKLSEYTAPRKAVTAPTTTRGLAVIDITNDTCPPNQLENDDDNSCCMGLGVGVSVLVSITTQELFPPVYEHNVVSSLLSKLIQWIKSISSFLVNFAKKSSSVLPALSTMSFGGKYFRMLHSLLPLATAALNTLTLMKGRGGSGRGGQAAASPTWMAAATMEVMQTVAGGVAAATGMLSSGGRCRWSDEGAGRGGSRSKRVCCLACELIYLIVNSSALCSAMNEQSFETIRTSSIEIINCIGTISGGDNRRPSRHCSSSSSAHSQLVALLWCQYLSTMILIGHQLPPSLQSKLQTLVTPAVIPAIKGRASRRHTVSVRNKSIVSLEPNEEIQISVEIWKNLLQREGVDVHDRNKESDSQANVTGHSSSVDDRGEGDRGASVKRAKITNGDSNNSNSSSHVLFPPQTSSVNNAIATTTAATAAATSASLQGGYLVLEMIVNEPLHSIDLLWLQTRIQNSLSGILPEDWLKWQEMDVVAVSTLCTIDSKSNIFQNIGYNFTFVILLEELKCQNKTYCSTRFNFM